jgi:hypothetical protein
MRGEMVWARVWTLGFWERGGVVLGGGCGQAEKVAGGMLGSLEVMFWCAEREDVGRREEWREERWDFESL